MKLATTLTCCASLLTASPLLADTLIEMNSTGAETQILSNGKKARVNTRGNDDYMLIDLADNSVYAVMLDKKQVINVSDEVPGLSNTEAPRIKVHFRSQGNGSTIAGFQTTRYAFNVNGQNCGTVYGSKQALKGTHIPAILDAMNEMAQNHRKALGGFAAAIPPCQMARMEIGRHVETIGAPLQIIDETGNVSSQVHRISNNANVNPLEYEIPGDFRLVTAKDKMQEIQQQDAKMRDMMKQNPEMDRMMQQMIESGRVPPEAMEQMQRYRQSQ